MKSLFESILSGDDLEDTIEKSTAENFIKAVINTPSFPYAKLTGTILGHTLQVTYNYNNILIYGIDTDILNKLNIARIHFKGCFPIFHCRLENISISSDREIHFGRSTWVKPMSNVKFEAPFVQCTYNAENPDYKNIEIIASHISFLTDPTPGTKKLSRAGFGKFTKSKFTVTDYCDQSIMDKVTKNVTLEDILPKGIYVSTKFISVVANIRQGTIGGYFITDPKYRGDLESESIITEPIGTLKDGWLITQTDKDVDYLRKVFK